MREWKSKINGKQIREAVKGGDSLEVLRTLLIQLKSKVNRGKDEYVKDQFEDLKDLVESDLALSKEELTKWLEDENMSLTELVDDRLRQFYDLCDRFDIWVTT